MLTNHINSRTRSDLHGQIEDLESEFLNVATRKFSSVSHDYISIRICCKVRWCSTDADVNIVCALSTNYLAIVEV